MKTFNQRSQNLTFYFFVFFAVQMHAQPSTLVPMQNAEWCYHITGDQNQNMGYYCIHPFGNFEIKNKQYAKIEYKYDGQMSDIVFYRVDSQKVYFLLSDTTEEFLAYDFGLSVNDTFVSHWSWNQGPKPLVLKVTRIDTIVTNDGIKRKQFQLRNNSNSYNGQWIEGIGDRWLFSLPNYKWSVSGSFSLSCFRSNGIDVFGDRGLCATIPIAEISKSAFTLSPNPTHGKISIQSEPKIDKAMVAIYDLNGRKIRQMEEVQYSAEIDLSDLQTGVYLIRITTDAQVGTVKVVKE